MYPYGQRGPGGVVVPCFADRAERPVDLEGSTPSMRDLFSLRTGRGGRGYRWRGHPILPNAVRVADPLVRESAIRFRPLGGGLGASSGFPFGRVVGFARRSHWRLGGIIVIVGNFYHSYLVPPIHCLGASSFLPFFGFAESRGVIGMGINNSR